MLYITGKMFWLVGNKIRLSLSRISYKTSVCMLASKSRCFEFYITKKSVFAFSSLKHARLSFIAQKTCFGLFAVILGCFRCYCTKKWFSSIMQGVTLIFTWFYSNNGFPFFWLSYAVSESSFWEQTCSLFVLFSVP